MRGAESLYRTLCVDFPVDSAKARTELLAVSLNGVACNPSETVGDGDLPRLNVQPRRGKSFVRLYGPLAVLHGVLHRNSPFSNTSPLRTFAGVGVRVRALIRHHHW